MTIAQTRGLLILSVLLSLTVLVNVALLQRTAGGLKAGAISSADLTRQLEPGFTPNAPLTDRPNSVTETVRAIQRELISRRYATGAADGVPGLMTRAAILAFEYDNGHPLTADPSQALLKAILLGQPGRDTSPQRRPGEHARQLIATVQASLRALGYAGAGNDGRLGETTRRAISEFEMDRGLPRTGRISPALIEELAKRARKGRMKATR